ncbi:MAG: Hpt domain-containing protein [Verrucomicrobia bacterium]|nr:Hpt domain-containing protein [Verrucomicrobiota bacterium]
MNRLFRAFHTIKGSGAMFGFEAVAAFTHHVETALDRVREGQLALSQQPIDPARLQGSHQGFTLEAGQEVRRLRAMRAKKLSPRSLRSGLVQRPANFRAAIRRQRRRLR